MFENLELVLQLLLHPLVFAHAVLQFALLVLEVLLDLLGALFALRELLVALVDLTVVFALELYELLLGLQDLLLLEHLAFGLSLLEGLLAFAADRCLDHQVGDHGVDHDGRDGDADCQNNIHVGFTCF